MDETRLKSTSGATDFFDTNVTLYALTEVSSKSWIADRLLHQGGRISVQVSNELIAAMRGKLRLGWPKVDSLLKLAQRFCGEPLPLTLATHEKAVEFAKRYGFHIYDATILASALLAGCSTLYSEDMQDGQRIESLTIRNPFSA